MQLRSFAANTATSVLLPLSTFGAAQAAGPVLHNTGTGLASNDIDPNCTIVGSPVFGPAADVKTEADGPPIAPGGWLLDSPVSAWIAPSPTFLLTTWGGIQGRRAADDSGLAMAHNDGWTDSRIDPGFVPGVNTLEFSARSTQNPTGLRVEFIGSAA